MLIGLDTGGEEGEEEEEEEEEESHSKVGTLLGPTNILLTKSFQGPIMEALLNRLDEASVRATGKL